MFSSIFRPRVWAPALLAACALAQASPVLMRIGEVPDWAVGEASVLYDGAPNSGAAATDTFTLQSAIASPDSQADAAPSIFSEASSSRPDKHSLAAASSEPLRREALELALWSFVKNIRAQQQGEHFELFQSTLDVHEFKIKSEGEVSAVPLPGAAWLFVMGVLGLAGSRVTRIAGEGQGRGRGAKAPAPSGAFAAAVPA
jgi:hypothetical protein